MTAVAATIGTRTISVAEVDAREREVRTRTPERALPGPGTSEARQLRRWLVQVLVAECVVAQEAVPAVGDVPAEAELLPDTVSRMELGSVAAATLASPHGRAVFTRVTGAVMVTDEQVRGYHARHPDRFGGRVAAPDGWTTRTSADLEDVRDAVAAHLLAAARRRAYRHWLDARCAELVTLADGWEHPGDPRQPDNTHRH